MLNNTQRRMLECGNLLQTQKQQLEAVKQNIEDPKQTYQRLCDRIDGMLTINRLVHHMLNEVDDQSIPTKH